MNTGKDSPATPPPPTEKTENGGQNERHRHSRVSEFIFYVHICSGKNPMMPVKSFISLKQSNATQMIAIYFSFPLAKQKWAP